jgi:hypothetical protein
MNTKKGVTIVRSSFFNAGILNTISLRYKFGNKNISAKQIKNVEEIQRAAN